MAETPFNIDKIKSNHLTEINYEIHNEMQGIVYDDLGCGISAEFSWSSETALESISFNCVRGLHQVEEFEFDAEAKQFKIKLGSSETPSGTVFSCEHEIEKCSNAENGYTIIVDFNLEEGTDNYGNPEMGGGIIVRPRP